jgi:hypothetical protein
MLSRLLFNDSVIGKQYNYVLIGVQCILADVIANIYVHVVCLNNIAVRTEHESRINEMQQLHDRQLQQLQSATATARQQDATTIAQQLAALDAKYTATVTGLREALKQTRTKLKQLLSNSSNGTSSGMLTSQRGATTASSRARYYITLKIYTDT